MRPSSSWGAVQGKAAQVKAAAKEKDDDEVSLDFSGDEVADVPMTIGDFQQNECYIEQEVVDDFDIDVNGLLIRTGKYIPLHYPRLQLTMSKQS